MRRRGYGGDNITFAFAATQASSERRFCYLNSIQSQMMAKGSTPAILGTLNSLFAIPQVQEHLNSSGSVSTPNSLGPATSTTSSTAVSTVAVAAGTANPTQPSFPSTLGTAVSLEGERNKLFWCLFLASVKSCVRTISVAIYVLG